MTKAGKRKNNIIVFIKSDEQSEACFDYAVARKRRVKPNRIILMGLMTALMGIFSCQAQDRGYASLSVNAFEKVIADTAVVRLDVRTTEEFADSHIENAINIDVLKDDFEKKALAFLPKGRTIAVNCRSGKRSKKAAEILVKNGFNVVELDAGFNGWVAAGRKICSSSK